METSLYCCHTRIYLYTYLFLYIGEIPPSALICNSRMFITVITKWLKKLKIRYYKEKEGFTVINYNETIVPWMRRFIFLWVRMGRWFLLWNIIFLPVAHVYASSYAYGIGYFWLIYAPVCGLFFNLYHNASGGEGFYFINKGFLHPIIRWVRDIFDRF